MQFDELSTLVDEFDRLWMNTTLGTIALGFVSLSKS